MRSRRDVSFEPTIDTDVIRVLPLAIGHQHDIVGRRLVVAVDLVRLLLLHQAQLVLYEFAAIALQGVGPDQVELLLLLLRRQAHLLVLCGAAGAHHWSLRAR